MSTAIMPDGSVVVRLASQTVHIDVRTRAIHLRAASARDELGGSILESFPQSAIDRVRLIRAKDDMHHLFLELRSGRALSLGQAPSHEMAMFTARCIADLTRCKVEISQASVPLAGPSDRFSAQETLDQRMDAFLRDRDPFEEPTRRLSMSDLVARKTPPPRIEPPIEGDVEPTPVSPAPAPATALDPTVFTSAAALGLTTVDPPLELPPPPEAPPAPVVESLALESLAPRALDDAPAEEEDPLDETVARPADTLERKLRVDTNDLLVPAPRVVRSESTPDGAAPREAPPGEPAPDEAPTHRPPDPRPPSRAA